MSCRSGCKDLFSRKMPAGGSGAVTGGPLLDRSFALFDLEKKHQEKLALDAKYEEGKQTLKSLQLRIDEMNEEIKKARDLITTSEYILKDQDADQAAERAERERKEVLQLDDQMERLKVESAELMERKQELQRQVEGHLKYRDFMERVVKISKFDSVQELTGHFESLLHFRDRLYQKESQTQEQIDQQRKALLTLEDQHRFLRLHKNNQLSQLQTELEETRAEALIWERKWNHIQETAAKKTLLLGQIKMGTLNLYEMINDKMEGEEAVDMNDTEKQLDKVKMFILDHEDIVKQHQTTSDFPTKDKPKKPIATHCKKHAKLKP